MPIEGVTFAVGVFLLGLTVNVSVRLAFVLVAFGPVFVTISVFVSVPSGVNEIEGRDRVTVAVRVMVCEPCEGDLNFVSSSVMEILPE